MRGDVTDIIAVILGVWFTIRKLDAQKRPHEEFAHVDPEAFHDWQAREVSVYQTAVWACFAKVLVNMAFLFFVATRLPWPVVRTIGATIFFAWAAIIVWTFVRVSRLRTLRRELGIVLGGFVVDPGPGRNQPENEQLESQPRRNVESPGSASTRQAGEEATETDEELTGR